MTQTKFTPGPWVAGLLGAEGPWAVGSEKDCLSLCKMCAAPGPHNEANANLIAKSPDFYEISEVHERRLRDCARNIQDEFPLWSKDLEKMADALSELLAKSRGES